MQQQNTTKTSVSYAYIHTRIYSHASRRCALADLILRFVTPLIPHLAFTVIHQGADIEGINSVTWKLRKVPCIPLRNLS